MMRLQTLVFAATVVALLALTNAGARDDVPLPVAPTMPGMQLQWVDSAMELNGLPVSIRSFRTASQPAEVIEFYTRLWVSSAPPTQVGNVLVLGRESMLHYYSLQVRANGQGAEGYLTVSVSPRYHTPASSKDRFPRQDAWKVLSRSHSSGPGERVEMLTLVADFQPHSVARWYIQEFSRRGWRLAPVSQESGTAVLQFARSGEQCVVTLQPGGEIWPGQTVVVGQCLRPSS